MRFEEAVKKLKAHEADLRKMGVKSLYMFGSTVRGEQTPQSDVDLFFDYEKGSLGLFELMDITDSTSMILGHKADIMTRDSLHPLIRDDVETNAIRVF